MRKALITGFIVVILLAACQAAPSANGNFTTFQAPAGFTPNATRQAGSGFGGFGRNRTPTVDPTPLATDTPVPTPTTESTGAIAAVTAQNYFNAIQKGDFQAAAKLVSAFSLRNAQMTAGDVAAALTDQQNGVQWSAFQIKDTQAIDDTTVLVHVTYLATSKDSKTGKDVQATQDQLWPIRQEVGNWLYNWGNIIDFHTLTATALTTAGLTLDPLQITRYSDHLSLTLLAQNNSNDPIVMGNTNQTLATFHFADKSVDADPTRIIVDRLRSYPDVTITVKGLFTSYPDSVDIIRFKDLKVAPWFSFNLAS